MDEEQANLSAESNLNSNIPSSSITEMMESNFLRYSMSVIVARALPDVRDGLKPVHRRILYSMNKNGIRSGGKTVKSARIIGDVMGKYHPHGNLAIYDAMARLAVDWSTRYPLIIGQGSFGTMDGDPPAADRYTEAKLSKNAEALLEDLDKETVAFRPNYDGTESEPEVLPAKLPNLLLNGQIGIAVGMATSIPPHNLTEVVDASLHLIDNPQATTEDVLRFIQGPDFPTGGLIYRGADINSVYMTGRGRVIIRGRTDIEEYGKKNMSRIVVSEIPYGINISSLIGKIADLVRDKKLISISDIRDESSRGKVRVVIDLKKGAYAEKVLNQLYKLTDLQTSFSYNMLALVDGVQPKVLGLLDILKAHLKHRQIVVRKRTEFELKKAQAEAHILEGLVIALDNIDRVIEIIRGSKTVDSARSALIKEFKLSLEQSNAILSMQLRTLSGLERQKIVDKLKDLKEIIKGLQEILSSEENILAIIKEEMKEIRAIFSDKRRSEIIDRDVRQLNDEDLIPNEQVLVVLTIINYIKRTLAQDYKQQGRGGKGRKGIATRNEDLVKQMISANTHDQLLFFTNTGRVFRLKCHEIPSTKIDAKGVNIVNLLSLRNDESISAMFRLDKDAPDEDVYLLMCTKKGVIKKTALKHYKNIRQNGLITINLDADDELRWVRLSSGQDEIIISTAFGRANRFLEKDVRAMGRTARGVRGIKLKDGDSVIGMDLVSEANILLFLTQKGFGKRADVGEFTIHKRGGIGVKSATLTEQTGNLVAVRSIPENASELVAISAQGKTLRTPLNKIRKSKRATKGVRVMRLDDDQIVSVVIPLEVEIDIPEDKKLAFKEN